jgi:NAD(P)H-hydrate repair Nnr-like enzyme with NAD(P)H-hydrate epimerase domain
MKVWKVGGAVRDALMGRPAGDTDWVVTGEGCLDRQTECEKTLCGVTRLARKLRKPVLALVGPGNNGGDALLAALQLAERGWAVHALALSADPPTAADAARVHRAWRAHGGRLAAPDEIGTLLAAAPLVIEVAR